MEVYINIFIVFLAVFVMYWGVNLLLAMLSICSINFEVELVVSIIVGIVGTIILNGR